jgi:diacylglycerol kinase family enzyme
MNAESLKKLLFFAESIAEICTHSLIAPTRPLRWLVIANPVAGGFVMPSRWKKCCRILEECRTAAKANPLREDCFPAETATKLFAGIASGGLIPTKGPDSAAEIATVFVDEIKENAAPFYLIITAGGDGTSLEVLSILYRAPASVRSNMAVLRLPMGTGNDGADSPHLAHALALLIKPSRVELTPALRLIPAPGGPASGLTANGIDRSSHIVFRSPFLAFNILSVGLDAFVTHMTNKMKGKLPGDFYKLWVDIAALLYDRFYTVGFLDVRALNGGEGGEVIRSFREKILLLAVGISGRRTYGSQKKILPDDRNVCALRQMPLLRKLALKGLFATGGHIDKSESILFNARRVEFSGEYPILAQMDGETVLLQREDFPAVIELTEAVIPVLKCS